MRSAAGRCGPPRVGRRRGSERDPRAGARSQPRVAGGVMVVAPPGHGGEPDRV